MSVQTRGFLFSDLRGYSAFTEQYGDRAARQLLSAYRRGVRSVLAEFHGAEVRTEGDSFYVVFTSVAEAVLAGLAIVTAVRDLSISTSTSTSTSRHGIAVGVGIHAGEVEDSAEGIVSSAVNIAARICAVAGRNQVLVSDTVRSLTRSHLEIGFLARGTRRLKGIGEPVRVFEAIAEPASRRASPPARWIASIVTVAVGLAVSAGIILVWLGDQRIPARDDRGTMSSDGFALGSPSPPSATVPPSDDVFPAPAERALLNRLPSPVSQTCVRADADEIPIVPHPNNVVLPPTNPLAVDAAVRCPQGAIDAYFFAATAAANTEVTLFGYIGRRNVAAGTCAGDATAYDRWSFGREGGWILCGTDMFWTYDGTNVLGRANGPRDAATIFAWWRDNARFLRGS